MAKTPPPVLPRDVDPREVSNPDVPPGAFQRAQSGALQARDFDRAGRSWRERYPLLSPRRVNHAKFLSRLRWLRSRAKFFWADHPNLQGSGIPILGAGRENLIRDAAMDTDSDGDGVVDEFTSFDTTGVATFSLDTTTSPNSQKIEVASAGASNGNRVGVFQPVLRVFPGDTVVVSVEAKAGSLSDAQGYMEVREEDADGNFLRYSGQTTFTQTSFGRVSTVVTVGENTALVLPRFNWQATAADGTGAVWYRKARCLRASSDPATWANPHVSGASQTGDTLDTAGWPADTRVLEAGDVFRIGGSAETKAAAETDEVFRSFEVLAPVDSDGSGNATIPVDPPIFSGLTIPDGAALRFENMRLRVGMPQANLPQMSSMVDKYGGISATLTESL